MPDAREEAIIEASENLRAYLNVLYDIFLERQAKRRADDSRREGGHDRFPNDGATPPNV